jgi:ABC-type cobalamin/Fe3+-siderophores transport system ATPase subunit
MKGEQMEINVSVPQFEGGALNIPMKSGEIFFLFGGNGTGKSSLLDLIKRNYNDESILIAADRMNTLGEGLDNSSSLQSANLRRQEKQYFQQNLGFDHRFNKDYQHKSILIHELIKSISKDGVRFKKKVKENKTLQGINLDAENDDLELLNASLKACGFKFQVDLPELSKVIIQHIEGGNYSPDKLSDGEMNALNLLIEILLTPDDSLILLDEPERHIHRSLVTPLLRQLTSLRKNSIFIISTHDVSVISEYPKSQIILTRNFVPRKWDLDIVNNVSEIDEDIFLNILGRKKKIVFVEGTASSLDCSLFSSIFEDIEFRPVGSCQEVIRIVKGLRNLSINGSHWVQAFGIIDRDALTDDECDDYKSKGIYALPFHSIESIYYHPLIYSYIAGKSQPQVSNPSECVNEINDGIIQIFSSDKLNFVEQRAKAQISNTSFSHWIGEIDFTVSAPKSIDPKEIFDVELKMFGGYLDSGNIDILMARYNIKKSKIPSFISRKLQFSNTKDYEEAVRYFVANSEDLPKIVKGILGTIAIDLAGN